MRRRDVLVVLATACAGVRHAHAQDKVVRRLGVVGIGPPPSPEAAQAPMAPAREFGWIEGQNITLERLWGGREDVDRNAADLVRRNVDVIVAPGSAAALAAKRATSRIPSVMVSEVDPVAIGLVSSLARPGGNVTGVAEMTDVTNGKRLELLRDLLPNAKRIGVVINTRQLDSAANQVNESTFTSLGMAPVAFNAAEASELFDAVNEAARQGMEALLLVPPGLVFNDIYDRLMSVAIERKLPVITDDADIVAAGALASLGNDWAEQYRTLWYFVDRVLRGAKPADLPVQQPRRFLIAINVKTAKALGVNVSSALRQRADQVFQ